MKTGKFDKTGREMSVGDVVHFRAKGISGRGEVFLDDENTDKLSTDRFRILDTRPGRNCGRIYPYYPDAKYRIDVSYEEQTQRVMEFVEKNDTEEICKFCTINEECPKGVTCYGGEPAFPPCSDMDEKWVEGYVNREALLEYLDKELTI